MPFERQEPSEEQEKINSAVFDQQMTDAVVMAQWLYLDEFKDTKEEAAVYAFEKIFAWNNVFEERGSKDPDLRKENNEIINEIISRLENTERED